MTLEPVTLASIAEDDGWKLITLADLLVGVTNFNGSNLSITALSIASGQGSLINNSDGTWSYAPAPNDDGSVTFSYTVSDGTLTASSTATLDITPVNDAPVTSSVTLASIAEDSGSSLITQADLLVGVTDVDGPNLSIAALSIQSGQGTLITNADGTWNYTPAPNDDGSVTFRYTASDGTLTASSTATLDITPVNEGSVGAAEPIYVSSAAELMFVLSNAKGGETILLRAGDYGILDLRNITFDDAVTIKSADANNPAIFTSLKLSGVENLSLDSIKFDYVSAPGAVDWVKPFSIDGCSGISIANSVFDGDLAHGVNDIVDGYGTGYGLGVSNSRNITIDSNEFYNWMRAVVFNNVDDVNVVNNDIHAIRSDGLDFVDMNNVLIDGNYLHDFVAALGSGDHADMIQFWTSGTTTPSTNITIRDNFLNSGDGDWTQSIFMRNEMVDTGAAGDEMFYQNILIEDNVIYNAHTHGITVGETHGLIIQNNTILQNPDTAVDASTTWVPTINIKLTSTDVWVLNNIVPRLSLTSTANATVENNLVVQSSDPNAPNYVGDLFVDALAGSSATLADLQSLLGGLIEQMGVGSSLTEFAIQQGSPAGFILDHASSGLNLLTHNFDASNLFGQDGVIDTRGASVLWNFGDGTMSGGLTAAHTFSSAGEYSVKAQVTLTDGTIVNIDKTIVAQTPIALRANFDQGAQDISDYVNAVTVGSAVTFEEGQFGQAIRLNGGLVKYGRTPELFNNSEYTVLFDFKKDAGNEGAAGRVINFGSSFVLVINSDGVSAAVTTDQGTKWLNANGIGVNDADWHQVALTFSGTQGSAIVYVDGVEVGRLSGLQGQVQIGSLSQDFYLGNPSGTSFPGLIDNVAFLRGAMSAEQVISYYKSPLDLDQIWSPTQPSAPVNDAPVASPVTLASIAEDGASRLITQANLLVGVTDVDGPNLSITALSIQSGKGTLLNNSNGTWSYTPAINDDGSVTFSYTASDGTLTAASTATLDITPVNDAPVASPVTLGSIAEDGASRLITQANLLVGVTDVDGPNLSITALSIQSGKGTLLNNSNGTWSYTPAINDDGSVTFSYTASDGTLTAASTATLDITPVNDAPVASPVTLGSIAEDGASRLITQANLLVGVTDVDGPNLSITALSIQSGKGTLLNNSNGTWSYTPAINDDGSVTFSYTASDGTLTAASTATLDITPVNDAPVASPVTLASIAEDGASRLITQANLLVGVTDVDGPNLSITALSIQSGKGTLIDNSNGTWSYTPAINDDGSVTFSYTASDGTLTASSTATLDITPVNDAPVATDDVATTQKNAAVNINVLSNDFDVDGNSLSIFGTPTALHGTVTLNSDGSLHYTTVSDYVGSDTISYAVTDGSLVDTGVVAVTVDDILGVTINGTTSNDVIDSTHAPKAQPFVTDANDVIYGNGGSDVIHGNGGDDSIDGGSGNDTLFGDAGNDKLTGGAGTDSVFGGDGNDTITVSGTSDKDDVFDGGAGIDTINVAGTGVLTLAGFDALTSSIEVWQGNGSGIVGTNGADAFDFSVLQSMTGVKYIDGGAGNDTIIGSRGNDALYGGKGNDVLVGGQGSDMLRGDAGNDMFVFGLNSGSDTITDFAAGSTNGDVVKFDSGIFTDFSAVLHAATQVGTSVVISYGLSDTVTLENVTLASLHTSDFILW